MVSFATRLRPGTIRPILTIGRRYVHAQTPLTPARVSSLIEGQQRESLEETIISTLPLSIGSKAPLSSEDHKHNELDLWSSSHTARSLGFVDKSDFKHTEFVFSHRFINSCKKYPVLIQLVETSRMDIPRWLCDLGYKDFTEEWIPELAHDLVSHVANRTWSDGGEKLDLFQFQDKVAGELQHICIEGMQLGSLKIVPESKEWLGGNFNKGNKEIDWDVNIYGDTNILTTFRERHSNLLWTDSKTPVRLCGFHITYPVLMEYSLGQSIGYFTQLGEKYARHPGIKLRNLRHSLARDNILLELSHRSDQTAHMLANRHIARLLNAVLDGGRVRTPVPSDRIIDVVKRYRLRPRHLRPLRKDIEHAVDAHQRNGVLITRDLKAVHRMGPFLETMGIKMLPVSEEQPVERQLYKMGSSVGEECPPEFKHLKNGG